MQTNRISSSTALQSALAEVPVVMLAFWVIKILSTTVGETVADYLAVDVGFGTAMTATMMAALLAAALALQFRAPRGMPRTCPACSRSGSSTSRRDPWVPRSVTC